MNKQDGTLLVTFYIMSINDTKINKGNNFDIYFAKIKLPDGN